MSDIDEMYLNYLDSLDVDSVLTPDGYTINKKGYEIFGVNLEELEQGGEKVSSELKDVGIGMARGFTKLTEGVGSLGLAALEKLDLVSDGSVQKFGDFFAQEVYPRIGETEGLAGGLTEGVAQFLAPGVGYYKLFGAVMKVPKTASLLKKIITNVSKVTAAEAATVGTAQVAGDPNLVSFLDELFGIEPQLGEGIAKEMFTYLATPELGKDADSVLREKIKSIIADTPAAYLTEGLVLMTKIFKGLKGDPKIIENVEKDFSAGAAMNPKGPLAKEIEEGTFEYKPELEGDDAFNSLSIMDSVTPVITGSGKNNKVKIDDILNHFDQAPKLDINNPDDFAKMVKQGTEEVKYQLNQEITGAGWYDKDIKIAMEKLDEINPKFKGNAPIKDFVVFLTAIASPGVNVGSDFKVGANIADIYLDTGKIPTTNPLSKQTEKDVLVKMGRAKVGDEKGWTQRAHLKGQLEFVQKYIDQNGLDGFLEFIHSPTTRRELNVLRKEYGMKPIAGALDAEIYGADMFGPKVSKFMQSLLGTSDESVPDIWFTRGFNRKSGNVYTIKKDGTKASADQPRNLSERKIMDKYIEEVRKQLESDLGIKLNNRDTQAVLWYFEQGLYTKLGVKSEPKSYADAAKSIIERKTNDIKGSISQSNVSSATSKEGSTEQPNIIKEDLDLDTSQQEGGSN